MRMLPVEFTSAVLTLKQQYASGAVPPVLSDAEVGDTITDTDKWLEANLPLLRLALNNPAQRELTHKQVLEAVHIVLHFLVERA